MADTPTRDPNEFVRLNIGGPRNETLFWNLHAVLTEEDRQTIQSDLDRMWSKYRPVKDDRLVALVAALCIENALDRVLRSIAPGAGEFGDDKDVTLSIKTKFVKALKLFPSHILEACDHIRQIRNEFAHHVEYERFEDLKPKVLGKLEPCLKRFIDSIAYDPHQAPQQLFKDLVGYALLALSFYTVETGRLREYLSSDAGQTAFRHWCLDRSPESATRDESVG